MTFNKSKKNIINIDDTMLLKNDTLFLNDDRIIKGMRLINPRRIVVNQNLHTDFKILGDKKKR